MIDDLVKRHRDECEFKFAPLDVCDCVEKNMADRIEELEQLVASLEAKLKKAAEALEWCATVDHSIIARFALAELKGKADE